MMPNANSHVNIKLIQSDPYNFTIFFRVIVIWLMIDKFPIFVVT